MRRLRGNQRGVRGARARAPRSTHPSPRPGRSYTATEVYLDTCAEWMPLSLEAAAGDDGGAGAGAKDATGASDAAADAKGAGGAAGAGAKGAAAGAAEAAAEAALRHKATASRYKNLFASQMYAFAEVGTVAFTLPGALGATGGASMLPFLAGITACLFAGALASLFVPDLHEPPAAPAEGGVDTAPPPPPERRACAGLRDAAAAACQSAVRSVTCLSAYNWLAALAVVPYFLSAAWADNFFQFVIAGTQCALRDAPSGVGIAGVNAVALFGAGVQAVAAFAGPALVGPRRAQFKEHVWVLALGNAAGAGAALAVVGLGGLSPRLCGSLGALLGTKALSSIACAWEGTGGRASPWRGPLFVTTQQQTRHTRPRAPLPPRSYGINNSVGVAAVLVWFDGPYQYLVVSALASRSVWYQLGGVVGPYTFGDAFAAKGGGANAAGLAASIYLAGSAAVVAAYLLNEGLERRRARRAAAAGAAAGAEAGTRVLSSAEAELARTRTRMTAGFRKLD